MVSRYTGLQQAVYYHSGVDQQLATVTILHTQYTWLYYYMGYIMNRYTTMQVSMLE